MKTIKWSFLILCISIGMSSCFQEKPLPSQDVTKFSQTTTIEAIIYINDHTLNLITDHTSPESRTIMNGTGNARTFGLNDITYSNSCETFLISENNIQLNKGEFEISGYDGISSIKGTYVGWGTLINNEFKAELVMEVTGGTGHFLNSIGNMSATIKTNSGYSKGWIMELNGNLSFKRTITYP